MDEIVAARLQVEAFARRIGADENANRLLLEWRIEGDLDSVALLQAGLAGEVEDPPVQVDAIAALKQAFLEALDRASGACRPTR